MKITRAHEVEIRDLIKEMLHFVPLFFKEIVVRWRIGLIHQRRGARQISADCGDLLSENCGQRRALATSCYWELSLIRTNLSASNKPWMNWTLIFKWNENGIDCFVINIMCIFFCVFNWGPRTSKWMKRPASLTWLKTRKSRTTSTVSSLFLYIIHWIKWGLYD